MDAWKNLKVLGVGGDDSNHAGDSKGEIIVATFSSLNEDTIVRNFPNSRDYQKTTKWLDSPYRDFRFTMLMAEQYRHSSQNLVDILPLLINSYINESNLELRKLKIYLDGRLERGGRDVFRRHFSDKCGIENIVVDNFIKKNKNKKGHTAKRPHCPELVYHADVLANMLYSNMTFEELSQHKKFAPLR